MLYFSKSSLICFSVIRRFLLSTLLVFCFLSTVPAQDKDDEIIKVDSATVVLNATITDSGGKPALGLKQVQFKIFEDGTEQKIDFFEAEKTPFAAIILLDTSGSMEARVSLARSAAINFLDGLRADDMTAIYNFDSKVSIVQDFFQQPRHCRKSFRFEGLRLHGFK
jgi:VWFA-related protein